MRKLLCVFCLISMISTFSQNLVFEDLQDIPVEFFSALTTSSWGGQSSQIYINCGSSSPQVLDGLLYYNLDSGQWSLLQTSESLIRRAYGNGEIIPGAESLYRFNGWNYNGGGFEALEIIDLNSGQVTYGANNPIPRKAAGSAERNGNIYTFGGCIDPSNEGQPQSYTGELYYYSSEFNSWTQLATMPDPRETRGEIIGDKLYVVGGYNGEVSNRIDVYNIGTNQWENQFVMPFGVSAHSLSVLGGLIFIVGDYVELDRIAYFDISNETFVNLSSTNFIGRRHSDVEIINNFLYITGGNFTSGASNSLQRADINDILNNNSFIKSHRLMLSPNPASSILNISPPIEGKYSYNIFDANGQKIISAPKTNQDIIKIEQLASGTYFVEIVTSTFSKTFKIIKG